ncbi:hypothetical protein [Jonesia quinghaiensis]|uniref:hypothetical protein n=1 Tax=Jonesia quinghaiensis TaxID=262806 RepID=UPI000401F130|nr:hypothetical protein [Jonesia quinghaiensis]
MSAFIEFDALLAVVVAGIVLGAGLPTLFALGVRAFTPQTTPSGDVVAISVGRKAWGVVCFGVCIGAIVAGVLFLAAGGHA